MRKIVGIDPGQAGGIAVIDMDNGKLIEVTPMPQTIHDMSDFIERHKDACCAYLEKVHSMPKQGVASSFKFGQNYGYVQMAVACHKIRCIDVTPQMWQQTLSITSKKNESKTQHKNRMKGLAQKLFPTERITLKTSDALLIAYYGYLKEK